MAITQCKECKKEVSTKARKCPHCGASNPGFNTAKGCLGITVLIVLLAVLLALLPEDESPKTPEEARRAQVENLLSPWDGSHAGLTEIIKAAMNDEDSYKHIETAYWDKGDHIVIRTTYSGKNSFGGVVKNWVMAKIDMQGNVVEILDEGS